MAALPIVGRELLVAARRPWTWWVRVAVAGLALVAAGLMLAMGRSWWAPQQVGQHVFYGVGIAAMCFAMLAGPFVTADAVSSERREGTLGLLFLTDLRSRDIVLGKLVAASLSTLAALLATLPLLALPMLVGGVAWRLVWQTAALLVVTLLMSLTLGLACSVLARNARLALLGTLTLLAGVGGLPWIAWAVEETVARHGSDGVTSWLLLVSPPYLATGAMTDDFPAHTPAWSLWLGIAFQLLLLGVMLVLACRRLPRLIPALWQGEAEPEGTRQRRVRTRRGVHAFWQAAGDRATRKFVFRVVLFFAAVNVLLLALSVSQTSWDKDILFAFSTPVAYFVHLLVKCQFAAEAADRFHHDRTTGGLDILLTTPLPVRALLRDYWRGLRVRFAGSRIAAASLNVAACILMLAGGVSPAPPNEESWWILALFITGLAFIWLDARALTWAALRASLRVRTAGRAMLAAIARVLVPGWVAILLWLLWVINGNSEDEQVHASITLWMAGFLFWDLWRAWADRRWLERHLRLAAAGDWQPPRARWRRWWFRASAAG